MKRRKVATSYLGSLLNVLYLQEDVFDLIDDLESAYWKKWPA